jgi:hypothetical protein
MKKKIIYILLFSILVLSCTDQEEMEFPSITTTSITSITNNRASSGGTVSNNGGSTLLSIGVCWNTSPNPTIDDSILLDSTGGSNFTSDISGLNADTTYFIRSFAANDTGISYGNELSFTTTNVAVIAPCAVPDNKLEMLNFNNEFNYTSVLFTTAGLLVGDHGLLSSGTGSDLRIEFGNVPETGIYKTIGFGNPIRSTECVVNGTFFNQGYRAASGYDVYVEKINDGQYSMTFCDLSFGTGTTSFPSFTAKANLKN